MLVSKLPESMAVAVIMDRRPSSSVWVDSVWEASGVTGDVLSNPEQDSNAQVINEQESIQQTLYSGFNITLYVDECESYYHNLKSPEPGCFVIARLDENEVPIPYLVTLSFDEAHAYLECEDLVYTVAIPPDLYRWTEAYVLENYVPEKRVKRKRKNWKNAGNEKTEHRA